MSLAHPNFSAALNPPSRLALLKESRTVLELVRMTGSLIAPGMRKASHSVPTIVIPGFGGDDRWTWPLRRLLARAGHRPEGWGLGRNLAGVDIRHTQDDLPPAWGLERRADYHGEGSVVMLCQRMVERVRQRHAEIGEPITLIGWSLGGYVAREVARDLPHCVSRVITLGTPVIGGPKYTAAASFFRQRGMDLDWIEREIAKRDRTPITAPITAIVSPSDGVVGPAAAIDRVSPDVRHVEIDTAHIGLIFSPAVWREILKVLKPSTQTVCRLADASN